MMKKKKIKYSVSENVLVDKLMRAKDKKTQQKIKRILSKQYGWK